MNNELKGQVAIITGGARGIGQAIGEVLGRMGANLVIADLNLAQAEATATKFYNYFSQEMSAVEVDVSSSESVAKMIKKTVNKFGKIDILINNAGITKDTLLVRMSEQDFDKVIKINLGGTFNCTKEVTKIMMKQRYGRIVNIASIIGIVGNAGQSNYAASKAGIIGFTKSIAREMASRNITVNAVAPGYIETEMTNILPEDIKNKMLETIPLKRFGQPSDVANAVGFLVSKAASYITAQVIVVDGGMI